jgi:heterodisulfide reductase subunit B
VLNKTKHYFRDSAHMRQKIELALRTVGLSYEGDTSVRHPLDVLLNDVGLDAIRQKVVRPLRGLRVAPYYGCQIVRPYSTFDDQYNPTAMDRLLEALGAAVVRYPLKTKCCGGSLTGTLPEAGIRLAYILHNEANKRRADCLVTVCPLCQFNLDAYHGQVASQYGEVLVPPVYFTQLMGLAFGLPEARLGLRRAAIPLRWRPPAAAA